MFSSQRGFIRRNTKYIKVVSTLNTAFLISALGDRLWAFSVGFIMHRLGGLSWVAIHQLIDAGFKLALATKVGSTLDRMSRLRGIQILLIVNNVFIALSALMFYFQLLGYGDSNIYLSKILLVTAIVFGSISRVASEAQKTAFVKDWLVVLIENSDGARLSTQNSIMNMIDHLACFITPIIAGNLLDKYKEPSCCLIIIAWNILSWVVETSVMMWIYSVTPELKRTKEKETEEQPTSAFTKYFRQKAILPMFGLSMLYMTVLGFDNLALSYGTSQGMKAGTIGYFRAAGSLLGFCGSASYAILERIIGVLMTGFLGLTLQNIFINFCSVSVFLPGNTFNITGYLNTLDAQTWFDTAKLHVFGENGTQPTDVPMANMEYTSSIFVFFLGITLARFGLWIADPAIVQIMQETIPEDERYSVNAVQNVFCEFFSILKDVLVIAFPVTAAFGCLIILSCVFVFIGYSFYSTYYFKASCSSKKEDSITDYDMNTLKLPEQEHLINKRSVEQVLKDC
ncbi:unnamed protein product [Auanema sp. JU1783]|nr:unnamed protein product [Auanema sp. JU1783]